MIGQNHIKDIQLPTIMDFNALKEEGLKFIQEGSGLEWTNFNPSDPGITILDQLCFALTELGYCMNFSIKDILTDRKGALVMENQFFQPDTILTTSAITGNDYIKLIVDAIPQVENVIIETVNTGLSFLGGIYQVYLAVDSKNKTEENLKNIYIATHIQLNTNRNLQELFITPKILTVKVYNTHCQVQFEEHVNRNDITAKINQAIREFVFPSVIQTGYDKLVSEGENSNSVFNGPKLKNGWVKSGSIGGKKNTIYAFEISQLIESIEGIIRVDDFCFYDSDSSEQKYMVTSDIEELLVINFTRESTKKFEKVLNNEHHINQSIVSYLNDITTKIDPNNEVESAKLTPDLPIGKYRDIQSYYSIQNTMPDAFKVGENSLDESSSKFQVAQSRQLKGYLTLFDQVLTNQFAQLANAHQLFSFKNSISGTPFDRENYYNKQDKFEKLHQKYPVPYESFSPTYFYQSLYDSVSDIRPLLKHNKEFNFSNEVISASELEHDSWEEYKEDPYNSYIWGVKAIVEDDDDNLQRRNKILDHLLARHGESPLYINNLCNTSILTGNIFKDRVIVKSSYLQNYQKLSYNRAKGYNYLGANKLYLNNELRSTNEFTPVSEEVQNNYELGNQTDFIVNIELIDEELKVSSADIINYSGIDLKINTIFLLSQYYKNYIIDTPSETAFWFLNNRKGFISIESNLLLRFATFEIVFKEDKNQWITDKDLSFEELLNLSQKVNGNKNQGEDLFSEIKKVFSLKAISNTTKPNEFIEASQTLYWSVNAVFDKEKINVTDSLSLLNGTILYFFPKFIPQFNSSNFQNKITMFFEQELPIHCDAKFILVGKEILKPLIKAYVDWHNELILWTKTESNSYNLLQEKSNVLAKIIIQNFTTE
ncbi:hypothetical protein SAMN04489761_0254 [Tenacibaculum sp. MAR_2009_124]|uniref:hypothetical protein n=1 Tax=Tenacibaculum sp. MAR_2009_124 TaxID=1250059 RepID=UPI00089B78B5|nr:hypothetical protein [Tenacibaculum sp. MAR_2009_124]SEB37442.1 hypothetical protein SAMN04489761_0254 [Tenacibaculum sp. MAR_2009_124]